MSANACVVCGGTDGVRIKHEGEWRHDTDGQCIAVLATQLREAQNDANKERDKAQVKAAAAIVVAEQMTAERDEAQAQVAALVEFYEAHEAVEHGVLDFDLHYEAVERLRRARDAVAALQPLTEGSPQADMHPDAVEARRWMAAQADTAPREE